MSSKFTRRGTSLLEILVVLFLVALLMGLMLPAVHKVRSSAVRVRCQSQLKQIGLGLHLFHDQHSRLPPGLSLYAEDARFPFLGWNARILPYLEQESLWKQVEHAFASDPEPFLFYGHVPHKRILGTPVVLFNCPADPRLPGPQVGSMGLITFTSYLGVHGTNQFTRDGLLFVDSETRLMDALDGTSTTLLVGERPPSADLRFGWWYRGWGQGQDGSCEMLLGAREFNVSYPHCGKEPFAFSMRELKDDCGMFQFWSLHTGGAHFLFADASARLLTYEANSILPALATRSGGEVVDIP